MNSNTTTALARLLGAFTDRETGNTLTNLSASQAQMIESARTALLSDSSMLAEVSYTQLSYEYSANEIEDIAYFQLRDPLADVMDLTCVTMLSDDTDTALSILSGSSISLLENKADIAPLTTWNAESEIPDAHVIVIPKKALTETLASLQTLLERSLNTANEYRDLESAIRTLRFFLRDES